MRTYDSICCNVWVSATRPVVVLRVFRIRRFEILEISCDGTSLPARLREVVGESSSAHEAICWVISNDFRLEVDGCFNIDQLDVSSWYVSSRDLPPTEVT